MNAWRGAAALLFLATSAAGAQRSTPDTALTRRIEALGAGFSGEFGVYVRHLPSGAEASIRPDEVFPTASLVKIPILLTLYDQAREGRVELEGLVHYPDTLTYRYTEPTDVVGYMAPGDSMPVSELAFLMMSVSDNHASLWLQALVGGGAAVNELMGSRGFAHTRVNSRTPGREEARSQYGWGQTTPREIAEAMVMIREGRAVSPELDERMYRMLTSSYWRDVALSQIPPTVQAASKQGFVDRARSEVLLVNSPGGDYVLAVMTRNQGDISYGRENTGWRLIRDISRLVYEHYNPGDPWRPQP